MEILATIKTWAGELAEVVVSVLALSIVLELLMGNSAIPFLPTPSVIGNVTDVVNTLGGQGLVGLLAVWVLYTVWKAK
jgi:hypothetical protein|tara:strand:+ start:596 stop:829 length:234 start_codon:yes stop_codon:yes gene_type:complete